MSEVRANVSEKPPAVRGSTGQPPMAMRRPRGLVIAWMPVSRRSATIAERLGFHLVLLGRRGFRRPWSAAFEYPVLAWKTITCILRRRPRAILVVTPPFLVALIVLPLARVLGSIVAMDVHSGALLDRRWRWSVPILLWISRHVRATVVTLPILRERFRAAGSRTIVLPDPLPRLRVPSTASHAGGVGDRERRVVALCGWGDDEPLDELAASAEGRPWRLFITGRPRRALRTPPNVELTGFLSDEAYLELIASADAVVVLTTRENTLLSGAWEAIALDRPLVLSDTEALRKTFGEGPYYVLPTRESIAAGVAASLSHPDASAASRELHARFARENDRALIELAGALDIDLLPEGPVNA